MEERPSRRRSFLSKRALSVQKNLRIVYVDLGAIYMQKKDYKEAQTALLRAVALDPALPDAHYQLGRLYQAQGKPADAEKELTKVRSCTKRQRIAWWGRSLHLRQL